MSRPNDTRFARSRRRDHLIGRLATASAVVAALLLVMAIATGCTTTKPNSLDGTSWRLKGWSVSSKNPADFEITAEFKDGQIGGRSAVNQYGGPYKTGPDDAFEVGQLNSTMMAGPPAEMEAESAYMKLLSDAKRFEKEGEELTLSDANGNQLLVFGIVK